MTNLLAELERVRGLVAAIDHYSSDRKHDRAAAAAFDMFRRPDFLALIEALREKENSNPQFLGIPISHATAEELSAARRLGNKLGANDEYAFYEWNGAFYVDALHTKERDDG